MRIGVPGPYFTPGGKAAWEGVPKTNPHKV